ncbi:hypothetical protein P167DRAFT_78247 [Morchella conica CCBAS932]|uniref:Uncharacterized protein n=1 Tax=Morchella conica CCBAS932 TaxID=1392247 RepID=A0A3N4KUK0_9PEZI|nr:hypothetical protein P167DRAFT_78247 [Morchella conica CCBAS932]
MLREQSWGSMASDSVHSILHSAIQFFAACVMLVILIDHFLRAQNCGTIPINRTAHNSLGISSVRLLCKGV